MNARDLSARVQSAAVSAAGSIRSTVVSALSWFLLCSALGLAQIVLGVYLLVGSGWACVASGVGFMAVASFIHKGMTRG